MAIDVKKKHAARPYHHGSLRQALLEAALAIIAEEGLSALTLRKAAGRAGVSHAAPKRHFESVTDLYCEKVALCQAELVVDQPQDGPTAGESTCDEQNLSSGVGVANDCLHRDGYSSRSASTGATLDARSAGSHDAASTVARDVAAAISSVRGSPGAMP